MLTSKRRDINRVCHLALALWLALFIGGALAYASHGPAWLLDLLDDEEK